MANKAKQYLKRISFYSDAVKTMEMKMTGLRAIDYTQDRVQTSPADRMADNFARLEELREEYSAELRKRIMMIDGLKNADFAQILFMRYIGGREWVAIADTLGYTIDTVIKYHGTALRIFAELYKSEIGS